MHGMSQWICVSLALPEQKGRKEMFYLKTHSTHFIYSYMALGIRLRTIQIIRGNLCLAVNNFYMHHSTDKIVRPLLHQLWSTGWNKK